MIEKFQISNFKFQILIGIVLLAAFLRLYHVIAVPPSPSLDEVSLGYNAYSILKTGADEYGEKFPFLLRAYDDWRPALYVYLVIPFVALFDLTVLAVRLPSVTLSIFTVIATYFLVKELFWQVHGLTKMGKRIDTDHIALMSAFLLAISPWHIYISRLGHEANAGLAFLIFGATFFVYKKLYLFSLFFALSFMSYQSEKIIVPIILLALLCIYKSEVTTMKKKVIFASLLGIFMTLPFVYASLTPEGLTRLKGTNVLTASTDRFNREAILYAQAVDGNDTIGKFFHNRRIVATKILIDGYTSHLNPIWLFTNPSNDKHKVPGLGLLYFWEAPLLFLGFISFFLMRVWNPKGRNLLIVWLLIAPIPAALTTEAPHAMRSYTILPVLQIISAIGFFTLLTLFRNKLLQYTIIFTGVIILLVSFLNFYKQYFIIFPKTQSSSFQYALSQAINFVLANKASYNKIVFSNQDNLYQSYMFFLFYSKYDPSLYQQQGGTKSGGFEETHSFGKYEFRPISWRQEYVGEKRLYIGNSSDFPRDIAFIPIYYFDGMVGIKIVEIGYDQ